MGGISGCFCPVSKNQLYCDNNYFLKAWILEGEFFVKFSVIFLSKTKSKICFQLKIPKLCNEYLYNRLTVKDQNLLLLE